MPDKKTSTAFRTRSDIQQMKLDIEAAAAIVPMGDSVLLG